MKKPEIGHRRQPFGATVASWLACFVLLSPMVAIAAGEPQTSDSQSTDLTELTLEELMNIEVTSVSKRAEKLSETAAAVYVITQEDIRRSGVTSVAEALRMAPGLDVARIDASKWAINSRGLNGQYAKQLLVLIDGRSVYTPLFGGVYWDVQDTMLEDIDRIEIIRGPGATMWGANAVNGVINIITKKTSETQDGLVTASIGTEERSLRGVRFGGRLGDDAWYRAYAKGFDWDGSATSSGGQANDDWDQRRGGFRIDWDPSDRSSVTLQGDVYKGDAEQTLTVASLLPPYSQELDEEVRVAGGNILARWNRVVSDTSEMALQIYYDRTERKNTALDSETRSTFDLDFQSRSTSGKRHEIMWGLGYRMTSDDHITSPVVSWDPPSRANHLLSVFVQDGIALAEDRLYLTLGSKFEHNDYTGFEIQPGVRLLYKPDNQRTAWAAVSRAVVTPSRGYYGARVNLAAFPSESGMPILMKLIGNPDFNSEELTAHELGYRIQPTDRLSLDIAAFYNLYDKLTTFEPGEPLFESSPSPPHIVVPVLIDNKMGAETYGIDISSNWMVTKRWRLALGYTWLRMIFQPDPSSGNINFTNSEGNNPRNQFHLRSYLDLPNGLEFDTALYYVDSLPSQRVPSYVRLDLRLGWRPAEDLDVSIGVQNLLDDHHPEYGLGGWISPTEVERNVYGKATWRFR